MEKHVISKYERKHPIDADLRRTTNHEFVVQCALTVGAPEYPKWTTLYWYALDPWIHRWAKHPARVGAHDDSPSFTDLGVALHVAQHIRLGKRYRARVISRVHVMHETLIPEVGV